MRFPRLRPLLILLMAWAMLPAPVDAALADRAITWTVDHNRKTITIKANLQFYFAPCYTMAWTPGGVAVPSGVDCSTSEGDIAKAIKDDIEGVWNRGYSYKCYRLIVIVAVSVTRDRFTVGEKQIGVRIDRGSNVRSYVHGEFTSSFGSWDSNDPSARVEPSDTSVVPSEWGYPPLNRHTYAHEFGHLLGLSDHYERFTGDVRAGAPVDLMSRSSVGRIDQSTIDRVVERNRDRLKDTRGRSVDLDDLVCDYMFRVTFTGGERYHGASHLMDSLAAQPCSRAPISVSTEQNITVDSTAIDVYLVEQPGTFPGYRFIPMPDPMNAFGLSAAQAASLRGSLLDLPIAVDVTRIRHKPASNPVPFVFDLQSGGCAGGAPGGVPPRPDCGQRQYRAWIAMNVTELGKVVPSNSGLPPVLAALGSETRLDRLYRNCTGPTPFPGAIANSERATVTSTQLPRYDELVLVSTAWRTEDRPGKKEVEGEVRVDWEEIGSLVQAQFGWGLTFCPLNSDGEVPPNCP